MSSTNHGAEAMEPHAAVSGIQRFSLAIESIERELLARGELGLLSISVLPREENDRREDWESFETILHEISQFLGRFKRRKLRRSDILLDPVIAGNTLVVLLGPPRDHHELDRTDITRVRHRLWLGVKRRLARRLPAGGTGPYSIYVGGALMRPHADVDCRRIIHRALEEAFIDALAHKNAGGLREAVKLRRVLRHARVRSVFQPVVDILEQRTLGFEALTRLPNGEFRSPDLLFRAAQENGVLRALERLCRRTALENLPAMEPEQLLFLNLEPESFHDPEIRREAFVEQLGRSGLRASQVVFELTERSAVRDYQALRDVLDQVRATGLRLAMDDVGAGYANLKAIAEIRPDFLKADITLVRDLHLDPIKRELIRTIRHFADTTGITLVAEGVESVAELRSLCRVGVRCAQGYLFARPAPDPSRPDWELLRRGIVRG